MSFFGRAVGVAAPESPGGEFVDILNETVGTLPHNRYEGIEVQDEGVALAKRVRINFIGPGVVAGDDSANGRTNVTIGAGVLGVNVTGQITSSTFTQIFSHSGTNGILGVGTIKNSGTETLEVRETATDFFTTTGNLTTSVAPGDTFLLRADVNIGNAKPPYTSFKVEVRHPGANATTFDMGFTTHGAS